MQGDLKEGSPLVCNLGKVRCPLQPFNLGEANLGKVRCPLQPFNLGEANLGKVRCPPSPIQPG